MADTALASEFLTELYGDVVDATIEIRQVPAGVRNQVVPAHPELPTLGDDQQVYFSAVPRTLAKREPTPRTDVVWADIEHPLASADGATGTLGVRSGKGVHLYWKLERDVPTDQAVNLVTLATLAYDGDFEVCEPARVMRLPGSHNHKYSPPVYCDILWNTHARWDPDRLAESLLARALLPAWKEYEHHKIALAIGGLLTKAKWSRDRAQRVVRTVCNAGGSGDTADKLLAIDSTYNQVTQGNAVSWSPLPEAFGKRWKYVRSALGLADDKKQSDDPLLLAEMFVEGGDWAWAQGREAKYELDRWESVDTPEVLLVHIAKYLQEVSPNAKSGDVRTTASYARGLIRTAPLPECPRSLLPLREDAVDLRTRRVVATTQSEGIMYRLPITFDGEAAAPRWEDFVAETVGEELVGFLQEWFGYLLVPGNPHERMLCLSGQSGTGKSTILRVVQGLLGEYAVPLSLSESNSTTMSYTLAGLSGAKVGICAELSHRMLQADALKSLVSGDLLQARHPYGRPFSFSYEGKILWAANELPPATQSEGLARRLHIIPCERVPKTPDIGLAAKLNAELPGILNWALDGWDRLKERANWKAPSEVQAEVDSYLDALDLFAAFANDELDDDPEGELRAVDIYSRFRQWCLTRGHQFIIPLGPRMYTMMRRHGLVKVRKREGNRWIGATLKPQEF